MLKTVTNGGQQMAKTSSTAKLALISTSTLCVMALASCYIFYDPERNRKFRSKLNNICRRVKKFLHLVASTNEDADPARSSVLSFRKRSQNEHTLVPVSSSSFVGHVKSKISKTLLKKFDKSKPNESAPPYLAELVGKNSPKSKKNYNEWWTQVSTNKLKLIQHDKDDLTPLGQERKSSIKSEFDVFLDEHLTRLRDSMADWTSETAKSVDFIYENFPKIADLNRKLDAAACVEQLSRKENFKKRMRTIRLLEILNSDYSNRNVDLFESYSFNNTVGEVCTEIVATLLKAIFNLLSPRTDEMAYSSTGQNLKDVVDSQLINDLVVRLLYSYLVELGRNRSDNVKRLRRLDTIKLYSYKIFNEILEFYYRELTHSEYETTRVESNCIGFVRGLLLGEPLVVSYARINGAYLSQRRNSELVERQNLFVEYIRFVEKLLRLVVKYVNKGYFDDLNGIAGSKSSSLVTLTADLEQDREDGSENGSENGSTTSTVKQRPQSTSASGQNMFKYLTSAEFYDNLEVYFQLADSNLNKLVEPLFNYLIFIKDHFTHASLDRISTTLDLVCIANNLNKI